MSSDPPREYLPELDGLRFLAFLLVFVHHAPAGSAVAWRALRAFGWIGVDLFFALSAYLFFRLLAAEHARTGTIGVAAFYLRRLLRIWPLYFGFCAATTLLDPHPEPIRVIGVFTFTDDLLAAVDDYNTIPWSAHLWTISYEEQFYLLVPFLLLFLLRSSRRTAWTTLLLLATGLIATRAVFVALAVPRPAIWVLPVTHFESILLGLAVGMGGFDRVLSRVPPVVELLLALSCTVGMQRIGNLDDVGWHLIPYYVLVGLATSLTLHVVLRTAASRWMSWLRLRPIVFLGKVSYGLYVYHLVALALGTRLTERFLPARLVELDARVTFVVSLAVSAAVATLSYFVVERPFLKLKARYEVVPSRPV